MNWEALFAIGSVVALLGAILLIPGLVLAKRLTRGKPQHRAPLTGVGIIYCLSAGLLGIVGPALLPILLRDTWLEQTVGLGTLLVVYLIAVMVALALVGRALQRRGFRPVRKGDA